MTRASVAVVTAAAVLVVAAILIVVVREQRQQATELTRLRECVSILERNQGTPPGDPVMGCPIYN